MMTIECGPYGFDFSSAWFGLILSYGDCEVRVGARSIAVMWAWNSLPGLYLTNRDGQRHWHWDEVRAWFRSGAVLPS